MPDWWRYYPASAASTSGQVTEPAAAPVTRSPHRAISPSRSSGAIIAPPAVSSAQSSAGTRHITSNSMPLGSLAYSDLDTRWSLDADEGASCDQALPDAGQLGQRADFPGQVIQTEVVACRQLAVGHREQAEIVIVGRPLRAQERGPPWYLHGYLEAEREGVEVDARGEVTDVQDGVVESADGHQSSPFSSATHKRWQRLPHSRPAAVRSRGPHHQASLARGAEVITNSDHVPAARGQHRRRYRRPVASLTVHPDLAGR